MKKKQLEDVSVQLLHETDRAWLVTDDGKKKIWIPKSMAELVKDEGKDTHTLTAPVWLLEDKELL